MSLKNKINDGGGRLTKGRRVTIPVPLGKKSRPTMFSSTELFPLDWEPITVIWGRSTGLWTPTVEKASWSLFTKLMLTWTLLITSPFRLPSLAVTCLDKLWIHEEKMNESKEEEKWCGRLFIFIFENLRTECISNSDIGTVPENKKWQ